MCGGGLGEDRPGAFTTFVPFFRHLSCQGAACWQGPTCSPPPAGSCRGPPLEQCRTPSGAWVRALLCVRLGTALPHSQTQPSQAQMGAWPKPLQGTSEGDFVDRNVGDRRQGWPQGTTASQTPSLFTPALGFLSRDGSELVLRTRLA